MKLDILTSDEDELFLLERIVKHVQKLCECTADEAVNLVNGYIAKFTDSDFCEKNNIPVQTMNLFCHIEAQGMSERVYYYQVLNHSPDENAFIEWQRKIRSKRS